jgi:hypothetical protein
MPRLTALLPLCLVALLAAPAAAQEASPSAELGPPAASDCIVVPRSDAEIAALAGTPAASNGTPTTEEPMALPEGEAADAATAAAITDTLRQTVACAEAGDLNRLLALYSDDYISRYILAAEPVPIVPGQPRPTTGTRPATPPASADRTPVVRDVRAQPDGRVVALVGSADPQAGTDVVFFVRSGDRWLIDEVHPAAATAGTPSAGAENPVVALVLQDASAQLGVPVDQLSVVSFESWEWPDTSLGCPKPDEFYAQVITPGYLIVVSGAGQQLEYHTDTEGHFVLCQQA